MMRAVYARDKGLESLELKEVPIPQPAPDEVRIKVIAAGLNPVDHMVPKIGYGVKSYPAPIGSDGAGIIDAVGSNVKNWKKGDRVYCFTGVALPNHGTLSEYFVADGHLICKLPDNLSFEEGATVHVCALTAAIGMFNMLKLPLPSTGENRNGEPFLIWGGSTVVGIFAIQFAKMLGFQVITTCSPKNFEYAKKMGATHCINAKSANVVEEIRQVSKGGLHMAFDCIGFEESKKCFDCLDAKAPGVVVTTLDCNDKLPENVKYLKIRANEDYEDRGQHERLRKLMDEYNDLLATGKLKTPNFEVLPNGLNDAIHGIRLLAEKKVSGKKLVITIAK